MMDDDKEIEFGPNKLMQQCLSDQGFFLRLYSTMQTFTTYANLPLGTLAHKVYFYEHISRPNQ
jgi:hypothetical protein